MRDADDPIPAAAESLDDILNAVHHGDCIKGMEAIPDQSIALCVSDPPFNIDYKYDVYDDRKTYDEYMEFSRRWITHVARVLTPDGTFWLAIGDAMAADLDVMVRREFGFYRRSWVVWYYTFGQNQARNLTKSHTHLLYYTRARKAFTFNADAVRIPSWRQMAGDKRAHPDGRLPDDTWIITPMNYHLFASGEDTWHCPRIAGTFKSRLPVATMMPEQVLGRVIRLCSNPGDIVLDPFAGSATTLAVAKKLGRRFLGFELSAAYHLQAMLRLDAAREGDSLDTPDIQEVPFGQTECRPVADPVAPRADAGEESEAPG